MLRRPHAKRALVNVGGPVETEGDAALCERLRVALEIRPGERDATLTHPFHAYPARLHPAVARSLLSALDLPPGSVVLDPFCGSGTVLVEAMAAGFSAKGRDLSPFATELARLKTRLTAATDRRRMVAAADSVAMRAEQGVRLRRQLRVPRGEQRWFHPHTLAELSCLRAELRTTTGFTLDALRMLFSSVLVKFSMQASDSDARRVWKDVPPRAATQAFAHKARELDRCLAAFAEAVTEGVRVDIVTDDATVLATVAEASVDAIVTSPPYANTYDYASQHARRYAWLDLDDRAMREHELGAARTFADDPEIGVFRFKREMSAVTRAFGRVLKPGGRAAIVMADGAAGEAPILADVVLAEAARAGGLRVLARASQSRTVFDETSARAFGNRPKREHVVVLEKRA